MVGISDDLSPEEIANILNEIFQENEVCSDDKDGLERSDHDSGSELFGDNSDDDPDFFSSERFESGAHDSSGHDESNNEDDGQPVDYLDGPTVERCVLGRRNKNMSEKKILPFKQSLNPPHPSRSRAHNIVTKVPGVIGNARTQKPEAPLESWRLQIDDDMFDVIIEHTNEK